MPSDHPLADPVADPAVNAAVDLAHDRLLDTSDGGGAGDVSDDADAPHDRHLTELIRQADPLLDATAVDAATAQLRARLAGVGGIERMLADPAVTDILVNGPGPVWVERAGTIEQTGVWLGTDAIALLIEKTVGPLGLRADRAAPIVDARLPDGSRVHVVLPPLAVDGPYVTIRRFGATAHPLTALCAAPVADLLTWALQAGMNVIVCGGTGAGKTTLLNSLCRHLPPGERIVTVEDTAELRLPGDHVVRMETRPATPDGLPERSVRDLVRAALRMRPDRLVVGEVRGPEAIDLLQALNTGHDGGLSTCHANSPADGLRRLETMSSMAEVDLPLPALREQLAAAVDLLVQVERCPGGERRIAAVAEVATSPQATRRALTVARDGEIVAAPRRRPRRPAAPAAPAATGGAATTDGAR